MIKEKVTTITTPGEDVDILITERGIAINPNRKDLMKKLANSKINIYSMKELLKKTHTMTGVPAKIKRDDKIIGHIEYRDGTVIDVLRKVHDDYIR